MRQTTRQKPAAYRQYCEGGETKKALWQDQPPSKPARVSSAWRGGGKTKKGELKENTGATTRETKVKTLPQATIVAGGRDKKAKTNTKWKGGTTFSPARGGECLAENAW